MNKLLCNKNLKKVLLIILFTVIIVLGIVSLKMFGNKPQDDSKKQIIKKNNYSFVDEGMYDRAKAITNEQLRSEHCLGDICIKDLMIYRFDKHDDVVLKVVNKGNNEITGQLNIVFSEMVMPVVYQNLGSGKEKVYTIQFDNLISSTDDYTVRELTSDELSKIKID